MEQMKLGFLASHNGSNMQVIIDACETGKLDAVPVVVISNNSGSQALERAKTEHIPYYHLSLKTYDSQKAVDDAMLKILIKHQVTIVILAGYMKKIGPQVLRYYRGKILNIHPALLPQYGGKGMYGQNVHEAVLRAREKETGVTIHLVDENYDTGKIVSQCKVPVYGDDTVETLGKRVLMKEHEFFIETLNRIQKNEIKL